MDGLPTINLNLFEQQDEISGFKIKEYWKSRVSSDVYNTFNFLGYTISKPYNKADIKELINRYEIVLADLPCIMIFNHLRDGWQFRNNEVIVIKIQGDFINFLKLLEEFMRELWYKMAHEYRDLINKEIDEKAFYEERLSQVKWESRNILITEKYKKLRNELQTFTRYRSKFLENLDSHKSLGHEAYKDVRYGFRGETLVIDFKW